VTNAPARPRQFLVQVFLAFACVYFLSALLRAVTATLAPSFSSELGLTSADLGLLAGAYFLGFALLQLPLGSALDRLGPKRVLLTLLVLAVVGCIAFASARALSSLFVARMLIGMGVSACLMAPLTCYRHLFSPAAQLRANSWMLMTGSLGMLASTLPVQWLLPIWGWRGLFWVLALLLVLSMLVIGWWVPRDVSPVSAEAPEQDGGYRMVIGHPVFIRCAPLGFVVYGGMIAVQALWAGPWLTRAAGWSVEQAAQGLFLINACMLLAFMGWGAVMPRLVQRGFGAMQLIAWGLPACLLLLAFIVFWPAPAGALTWAAWCVSCTFVSLSQPAVGQAFVAQLAGRALSAFNLVIFSGVFAVQWGIGLLVDGALSRGASDGEAFRWAFGVFGIAAVASYLWFLWRPAQEAVAAATPGSR
jgi:predicted MFS family arabinose efflux permease